jgi:hypothetical protein
LKNNIDRAILNTGRGSGIKMPTKYTMEEGNPVNVCCKFVKVNTKKDEAGVIPFPLGALNPHILSMRYERKYDSKDHLSSTWIVSSGKRVRRSCVNFFPSPLPYSILAGWKIQYTEIIYSKEGVLDFLKYFIQHCFICRPSDSTVAEDAGTNPGLLHRLWQKGS